MQGAGSLQGTPCSHCTVTKEIDQIKAYSRYPANLSFFSYHSIKMLQEINTNQTNAIGSAKLFSVEEN